jgi:hypothetical protein
LSICPGMAILGEKLDLYPLKDVGAALKDAAPGK